MSSFDEQIVLLSPTAAFRASYLAGSAAVGVLPDVAMAHPARTALAHAAQVRLVAGAETAVAHVARTRLVSPASTGEAVLP